jgi:simple sugar transport system permease protein
VRWSATLFGGGLTALGGAYLSVVNSHMWVEQMTSGRGWIAVALIIFGIWHPLRSALGAYLFGGVGALQLRIQAGGTSIPAPLLLMLPYVLTIVVLTAISIRKGKGILLGAPAALGQPFHREERE